MLRNGIHQTIRRMHANVAIATCVLAALLAPPLATDAVAQIAKPNIVFIMGDDIGM